MAERGQGSRVGQVVEGNPHVAAVSGDVPLPPGPQAALASGFEQGGNAIDRLAIDVIDDAAGLVVGGDRCGQRDRAGEMVAQLLLSWGFVGFVVLAVAGCGLHHAMALGRVLEHGLAQQDKMVGHKRNTHL